MFVVCSFFHSGWSAMTNCFGLPLVWKESVLTTEYVLKGTFTSAPGLHYLPTSFSKDTASAAWCQAYLLHASLSLLALSLRASVTCPHTSINNRIFATQSRLKHPLVSVQILENRHLPEASFSVFSEGLANHECVLECNQKQTEPVLYGEIKPNKKLRRSAVTALCCIPASSWSVFIFGCRLVKYKVDTAETWNWHAR